MTIWQEELLNLIFDESNSHCERQIFSRIETAAFALGFEYAAYGFRSPLPMSNPQIKLLNNYPKAWQERYEQARYLKNDPTVLHGRQSQKPLLWRDSLFEKTPVFWDEAQSFGLKIGWSQSCLDGLGSGGMLSLARSHEVISEKELKIQQYKMRYLVHVAHVSLSRLFKKQSRLIIKQTLTQREQEILKWTADGKSSQDIADILTLSKNTVDFHVKNAVNKLQTSNKTAAVVRAAMLGYLD